MPRLARLVIFPAALVACCLVNSQAEAQIGSRLPRPALGGQSLSQMRSRGVAAIPRVGGVQMPRMGGMRMPAAGGMRGLGAGYAGAGRIGGSSLATRTRPPGPRETSSMATLYDNPLRPSVPRGSAPSSGRRR